MLYLPKGDDLRRMRLASNRSSEECAKHIGKSRPTLENYESGKTEIGLIDSIKLCAFCGFDVTPFTSQFEHLKDKFAQYKYKDLDDETKPNQRRVSKKKNHLRPTDR
ncbi:helix-turn-helix transcriptional regulator [Thalassomonas viridans]|uniref:Helix-turn-helix transcriptional regulator n=1 Tax=Thalassomonas viridans TaxID=137584 RepID=A0AAE9Z4G1_9GAMM|nr:helix-turn-helix transcriptional regulator [Thalassomonas viridans]WDE06127.1 helix-turn-helix transcriptional regulator [Thalassomonas viridans]